MEGKENEIKLKEEIKRIKQDYERLLEANQIMNERLLELYTLYNVSKTLSMSIQLNELFDLAMNLIGKSLNVGMYSLMLIEDETGDLSLRAQHGLPDAILMHGPIKTGEGLCARVFNSGEPVIINDMSKQDEWVYFKGSGIEKGSYLGVPLLQPDGSILGVLNAHKPDSDGFKEMDERLFKAVAEHVAVSVDHALAFQQTQELMSRDELTNLHNRRYFFERFEREVYRAERYKRSLSVLMIDIDHFKNMNDTYGHLRGDQALKNIARILEKHLRKADIVARYGGEEFLILLPETDKESAAKAAEKLREEVAIFDFNQDAEHLESANLTITIGVASMPEDSAEAIDLIDLADKALYFGKAQGRNQVCTQVPKKEI